MAAKQSLTALQNKAARSELEFVDALAELGDAAPEEFGLFFGKLNIPRTLKEVLDEGNIPDANPSALLGEVRGPITDLAMENSLAAHFGEFHTRHLRKLQWHSSKPDPKGVPNVRRLYRAMVAAIYVRLVRVSMLLDQKTDLTAAEWGYARALINKSMADFRDSTEIVSTRFAESMTTVVEDGEAPGVLSPLRETLQASAEAIEKLRVKFEARRQELSVIPNGYPPVTPAPYFAGDVLESSTWTRFRSQLHQSIHTLNTILDAPAPA